MNRPFFVVFEFQEIYILLVEIAVWHSYEDGTEENRSKETGEHGLNKYGILDLTQCRFFNPNFTIKDLPDDIALLVFDYPRGIFVAVLGLK